MSAESLREQIAETLTEHLYAIVTSPLRPACMCGWEASAEWSGTEVHDFHVADAVLAALGEVTVTEEWAIRYDNGDLDGGYDSRAGVDADIAGLEPCDPARPVRRTAVTTRRVGEWEEAE